MVKYGVLRSLWHISRDLRKLPTSKESRERLSWSRQIWLGSGQGRGRSGDRGEQQSKYHDMLLDNKLGDSGARVVIEEFLDGEGVLSLAFVNGDKFYILPGRLTGSQAAYDGDKGPNTGGMGIYAPVPTCYKAWWTK